MSAAKPTLERLGERGFLGRIREFMAPEGADGGRLLIAFGDDAAVWNPAPSGAGRAPLLVATLDTMVEDTHFRRAWATWEDVGRKLVASNVSDIAAMGARPTIALFSLAAPPLLSIDSIDSLYKGFAMECARWSVAPAGGDTVRAPQVTLTLALLGEKDPHTATCRRDALRPGQRLYVTGWPGESGAGFSLLRESGRRALRGPAWRRHLILRHLAPEPRPALGMALATAFSDLAMIDISDGLDNEARLLAEASGARLRIRLAALPVSLSLRAWAAASPHRDPAASVLYGGEDYELLFATSAPPEVVHQIAAAAQPETPIHEIGEVAARRRGGEVIYVNERNRPVEPPAGSVFQHFRRSRKP